MAIPQPPILDEIPLPDPPGLLGGWGIKLEITLLRFILSVYNGVMSPFWHARDIALNQLAQSIEDELKPVIEPLIDKIEGMPNLPPEIRNMTQHLRFSEPITFAAIAAACIMAGVVGLFMGLVAPFQRLMAQETDSYVHSARMSPPEAFAGLKREALTEGEFHNQISDGGWSERMEEAWKTILAPLTAMGDISQLYVREEMSEGEFDGELGKRGYQPEEIAKIKVLLKVIPPLPDIIRMAVREAFTPDVVSEFQLHAELPAEMVSWAKKQGLSEEWARAYWASHWTLPGLSLGYEMLHRDVITDTQMQLLIKAQDVSPFWRDKLLEISYSPYTRVDVRRMFATGVIGQEEVKRTYLDLGYDEEKATNLTAFTVALANEKERDLTKTEILWGFEVGFFSPGEATDLLIGMGYDTSEATYYLAKVEYKRWQKIVSETIKYIGQQYIGRQIDEAEVYVQLGALNLPSEQMNRLVRGWDLKRQAKTKRLTADRLVKFRTANVINNQQFSNEMSGLGYSARYITWYLQSIGMA